MGLAGIAGMNLKLPWEEAKKAADELYAGLQEDAAKTPAETEELVAFSQDIAGAYLAAGKNMQDLRQFTTQAVVAAKMLKAEGTAATDIKQAIQGRVGIKDMFAANIIKSLGMTIDQFNKKTMKERADLFAKGLNNPTIRAAMAEYEENWDGVTSTIKDNISIILGEAGKPLFGVLKKALGEIGKWIQANKEPMIKFFRSFGKVFEFLVANATAVMTIMGAGGMIMVFNSLSVAGVAAAAKLAASWMLAAAPFILIGGIIAGMLLIFDDLRVYSRGGKSLFGLWKNTLDDWLKPQKNDPWWLSAIKEFVGFMKDAIKVIEDFDRITGKGKDAVSDPTKVNDASPSWKRKVTSFGPKSEVDVIRDRIAAGEYVGFGDRYKVMQADKQPMGSPEYRAPSGSAGSSSGSQINQFNITQQPGESGEDLARRITSIASDHWDSKMEEAHAGTSR